MVKAKVNRRKTQTAEERRKKLEEMKKRRKNNQYIEEAKKNLEGVTRVTRQEQAKKISGKDAGDSLSTRDIDQIAEKDASFWDRIKKMVKKW